MEHGHNHLERALVQFLVLIDRYSATVVFDSDRVVLVDRHLDVVAKACHSLVYRVVYGLVDEVVQTFFADVADIHGRTFAHGFQALQHLDVGG